VLAAPKNSQPVVEFKQGSYSASENQTNAIIAIKKTPKQGSSTFHFRTAGGTATGGTLAQCNVDPTVDFVNVDTTVTIASQAQINVTVPICNNNNFFEGNESVVLQLYGAVSPTSFGSKSQVNLNIQDDDAPVTVSIGDGSANEGDPIVFDVTLSQASPLATSMRWETTETVTSGSPEMDATQGDDYPYTTGTVTFAPGQTTATVAVPTTEDGTDEHDQTFKVRVISAQSLGFAVGESGVGTIVDDDDPPELTALFNLTPVWEGEDVPFGVTLSLQSEKVVTVDVATVDGCPPSQGSACFAYDWIDIPDDVSLTTDTLTFAPGATQTTFTVPGANVVDDDGAEFSEYLAASLSNATNATIGTADGVSRIRDDDAGALELMPETQSVLYGASTEAHTATVTTLEGDPVDVWLHFDVWRDDDGDGTYSWNVAGNDQTGADGIFTGLYPHTTNDGDPADDNDIVVACVVESNLGNVQACGDYSTGSLSGPGADVLDWMSVHWVTVSLSIDDVTQTDCADLTGPPCNTNDAVFTVTLSGPSAETVTVDWATSDGTASAGSDYAGANGTLVFVPGDTSETISIDLIDTGLGCEGTETFSVTLSNSVFAAISDGVGTGTINDIDC
jgi:hypothetical protein